VLIRKNQVGYLWISDEDAVFMYFYPKVGQICPKVFAKWMIVRESLIITKGYR
jgi:hypothetical protein